MRNITTISLENIQDLQVGKFAEVKDVYGVTYTGYPVSLPTNYLPGMSPPPDPARKVRAHRIRFQLIKAYGCPNQDNPENKPNQSPANRSAR